MYLHIYSLVELVDDVKALLAFLCPTGDGLVNTCLEPLQESYMQNVDTQSCSTTLTK